MKLALLIRRIRRHPRLTCCQLAEKFGERPDNLSGRLNRLCEQRRLYRWSAQSQRPAGRAWRYGAPGKGCNACGAAVRDGRGTIICKRDHTSTGNPAVVYWTVCARCAPTLLPSTITEKEAEAWMATHPGFST